VVGVDNLDSSTLPRSKVGHPLQRIDPAPLGEGVQAHRQYLHCPHQVEPRWLGWLRRFAHSRNIPSNYGHALLRLGILCVGLCEGYVGHHIIWWGYRCTTPPCLLLWPSVITWQRRDPTERWHNIGLCTTRLCGGGSLLYDSSSFIFLHRDKESLFQPIFPPLDEKPKPCIRKG
jgi:hypothetical protein